MPFDGISREEIGIWDSLGNYVSRPYATNPPILAGIRHWHDTLVGRRAYGEDLRLSFVRVENIITGDKFEAYCLNDQLYISDHPLVLALPFFSAPETQPNAVPHHRWVGLYAHDFGFDTRLIKYGLDILPNAMTGKHNRTLEDMRYDIGEDIRRGVFSIHDQLSQFFGDPSVPGGNANKMDCFELRFTRGERDPNYWHRDSSLHMKSPIWTRVIINTLLGGGTLFDMDGNKSGNPVGRSLGPAIDCPAGFTSSHVAVLYENDSMKTPGAHHLANTGAGLRAILIRTDKYDRAETCGHRWQPGANSVLPWKVTKLPTPGF